MADQLNPLLVKAKLPGRVFQLPSGGWLYNDGELSENTQQGEIHVHQMSGIDEIVMKNPDMLFSGRAVEEVFNHCVPEIKKPFELAGKDVDAIMCFLRIATYGPMYNISIKHNCEHAKEHEYEVNIEDIVNRAIILDPSLVEKNYILTLPNGQVVKFHPVRYKNVVQTLQSLNNEDKMSAKELQDNIIENILNIIQSVDGIEDKKLIGEWLITISAPMMHLITSKVEAANNWGIEFKEKLICPDCGQEFFAEIPINPVSFFSE